LTVIPDIGASTPNMARVYNALQEGGKDNYEADRELARALCDPARGGYEGLRRLVSSNRAFIGRAVAWARDQGIRQFADLGCGLPAHPAVHETARMAGPGDCLTYVAYVDRDPVVLSHVRALYGHDPGIAAADADLADPGAVLADPGLRAVIDLGEPALVLLAAVLHFVPAAEAAAILAGYAARLAPGSCIAVSSVRFEAPGLAERMAELYTAGKLENHSRDDVTGWLEGAGLEIVPPGVVSAREWRGDRMHPVDPAAYVLAGAGRKG
jgi:hypothetical protein